MSCNCNEDKYNGVRKHSDDGNTVLEQMKGIRKMSSFVVRVFLGILLSIIVIIALPFAILYVVFSVAFGKSVKINLKKVFRINGGK